MKKTSEISHAPRQDLMVDGDTQADTAVNSEIAERIFTFCEIKKALRK